MRAPEEEHVDGGQGAVVAGRGARSPNELVKKNRLKERLRR
jgi:hypothetical protein